MPRPSPPVARRNTTIGLTKEYKNSTGGSKLAVDKLDLTMYTGQITALLGHNGAGKVRRSFFCFVYVWLVRLLVGCAYVDAALDRPR